MSHDSGNAMTCWNCDEIVDALTQVGISTPTGGQASLALCPRCFETVYQPLESDVMALRPPEGRLQTVLVVDDDPDTRGMLSLWLHDEGFQVRTAANGLEALQRVQDQAPEVIILDLQMPVMDGREFLKVWRNSRSVASIPVVAISGYQRELIVDELGVEAFFPKPLCLSALKRAIVNAAP
jgi:CheY-like chemotaxis protein